MPPVPLVAVLGTTGGAELTHKCRIGGAFATGRPSCAFTILVRPDVGAGSLSVGQRLLAVAIEDSATGVAVADTATGAVFEHGDRLQGFTARSADEPLTFLLTASTEAIQSALHTYCLRHVTEELHALRERTTGAGEVAEDAETNRPRARNLGSVKGDGRANAVSLVDELVPAIV